MVFQFFYNPLGALCVSIPGRNFEYSRALEIIQSEDYLDDSDFDDIRRNNDIFKKIDKFKEDWMTSGWRGIVTLTNCNKVENDKN